MTKLVNTTVIKLNRIPPQKKFQKRKEKTIITQQIKLCELEVNETLNFKYLCL